MSLINDQRVLNLKYTFPPFNDNRSHKQMRLKDCVPDNSEALEKERDAAIVDLFIIHPCSIYRWPKRIIFVFSK